jgi:tRNA threonylcarbamoyladenosine biosynthesis protein TsaB
MYVLALDTTTADGSAALVHDARVVDERRGDGARGHAERLPAELTLLPSAHGVPIDAIDVFAVASGPGSFTGLRIGIATVQGLAVATGRRIVAISALEALAHTAQRAEAGTFIAAWMDARRRDVFAALYRVGNGPAFSPERLVEVEPPTVGSPDDVLERWAGTIGGAPVAFVGDGAALYADSIDSRGRLAWSVDRSRPLLAAAIGLLAVERARRGATIDPAAVQPLYVRRPDAELARDHGRRGAG